MDVVVCCPDGPSQLRHSLLQLLGAWTADSSHIKFFFKNEDCIYLRCTTFNAPVETAIKVTPPSWGQPILKDRFTQG